MRYGVMLLIIFSSRFSPDMLDNQPNSNNSYQT
jgi:hypothetical protein